jgi:hypothetical protein
MFETTNPFFLIIIYQLDPYIFHQPTLGFRRLRRLQLRATACQLAARAFCFGSQLLQ